VAAAQNMNMGTAGFVKKPGKKDLVPADFSPADRAGSEPVPLDTINTAGDVYQPVLSPQGRKSRGFYPFPRGQPGGTKRTGLGGSGPPGGPFLQEDPGLFLPAPAACSKKKAITKPEKKGT
jgi:hypothetical protein